MRKGRSIVLLLPDGSARRIAPATWHELKRRRHAVVERQEPFTVRLRELAWPLYGKLYRWTERSGKVRMMGSVLMKRLPSTGGFGSVDSDPPAAWGRKVSSENKDEEGSHAR